MDEGEGKDFGNEVLLTHASQKAAPVLFIEFLQKLQTHGRHTRTTIIRTRNHFIQQTLRILYEPGSGKMGISMASEFTFPTEAIHTFSPKSLYIVKALDFYRIS